jgi:drug/metabolite transporter (DMT)-like permease
MQKTPSRGKIIAAFAALYIIWGSTYLAIVYAIETIPPLLMAGVRFLIAGSILYGVSLLRSPRRPTRAEWKSQAIIGACLVLGGNGAVVFAEQMVPSGIAALLVAVTPCWMVLLDWKWNHSRRPGGRTIIGLLLGVAGIALLTGPDLFTGEGLHPLGVAILMCGSLAWSVGSIYSKRAPAPPAALLAVGMQMLCGGVMLLAAGVVTGEPARLDIAGIKLTSILAFIYLIIFGAIIAYSCYIWLLRVVSPASVSTYSYVNPVVAVILGWWLANEELSLRMVLAAAVIIAGVVLITIDQASSTSSGSFTTEHTEHTEKI